VETCHVERRGIKSEEGAEEVCGREKWETNKLASFFTYSNKSRGGRGWVLKKPTQVDIYRVIMYSSHWILCKHIRFIPCKILYLRVELWYVKPVQQFASEPLLTRICLASANFCL